MGVSRREWHLVFPFLDTNFSPLYRDSGASFQCPARTEDRHTDERIAELIVASGDRMARGKIRSRQYFVTAAAEPKEPFSMNSSEGYLRVNPQKWGFGAVRLCGLRLSLIQNLDRKVDGVLNEFVAESAFRWAKAGLVAASIPRYTAPLPRHRPLASDGL